MQRTAVTESRERIYAGRIVKLWVERVRLPNGSETELEIIRHQGAAAIVPIATSTGPPRSRTLAG